MRSKADHERVLCVWLRESLGLHSGDIATALGWQPSSVRRVQARYRQHGAAALLGVGRGGRRHALLSVDQETRLLAAFASVAGEGGVTEAGRVRRACEAAVGHAMLKSTVYRLLARHGWRKLVPRGRHRDADPAAQQAFQKSCAASCAPRRGGKPGRAARCG